MRDGAGALIDLAYGAAAEMRRRFNLPLVMIVIDSMQVAAGFKKEGEGAEGTTVMGALHELAEATSTCVLAVDHFGKDIETGTRGALTKEDRANTVLALLGERTLTGSVSNPRMGVRKQKESEGGRVIPFRMEEVDCGVDEDGDPVTSMIVHWEPDRPPPQPAPRQSDSTTAFMTALQTILVTEGNRDLFSGLVVVPERAVHEVFVGRYMASKPTATKDAAGQRWREARKRAIGSGVVELRTIGEVGYFCYSLPASP